MAAAGALQGAVHAVLQPVAEGLWQPVVEGQWAGREGQEGEMLLQQGAESGALGPVRRMPSALSGGACLLVTFDSGITMCHDCLTLDPAANAHARSFDAAQLYHVHI